jgi:hypothetical protein
MFDPMLDLEDIEPKLICQGDTRAKQNITKDWFNEL